MPVDQALRITFLSQHYWESERRAGFHGLAQTFLDIGATVRFVTTGFSRLSMSKTDARLGRMKSDDFNRWTVAADGVDSYVYCPSVHPFSRFAAADLVTDRFFAHRYRREVPDNIWGPIVDSDIIVFESNASLLLAKEVRRRAPKAKLVYRVSDDVRVLNMAQSIVDAEKEALEFLDLVSVGSRLLLARRFGGHPRAAFHAQGLDLPRLEAALAAPRLDLPRPACVALGTTLFDPSLLSLCAKARPDVQFHMVGAFPPSVQVKLPNVIWCGERPFAEALNMAASCDFAGAFYKLEEGTAYLAETSNKIYQYTYFQKPIIGPAHLADALWASCFFPIAPQTPEGAKAAIDQAIATEAPKPPAEWRRSWSAVRDEILRDVGLGKSGAEDRAAVGGT